jgi:adenine-specific DNA-methyltransferase
MLAMPTTEFEELFTLLFPLENADLDFGLYRLLNARRGALRRFFLEDLPAMLHEAVRKEAAGDRVEAEIAVLKQKANELGVALEEIPRYKQLQVELSQIGTDVLEAEALRHLRTFVGRYYVDGDFIPMRRFRSDAYLLPYDGSETAFIYANQDQYFTKSDQLFETFRVRLTDGRRVTCKVTYAEESLGNNDDSTKQKRRYKLHSVRPTDEELVLGFAFQPSEQAKQDDLNAEAVTQIQAVTASGPWFEELFRTEANGKPWILRFIERFTRNIDRDYFVHKQLRRFLLEELDRYAFTDVFPRASVRDDGSLKLASRVERIVKAIATPLIELLAQFEDLQRDLWLKERLVVDTRYCLTLDRVPAHLLPTVVKNSAQRSEWQELYGVERDADVSAETHPGLFLDTRHFDKTIFSEIEASMAEMEADLDGHIIVSENTAALRTFLKRLRDSVNAIYIDPPFNTGSGSAFRYKNGYRHSSWCCLMDDALSLGGNLLTDDGILAVAIDDTEYSRLQLVADRVLGESRRLGTQVFVTKRSGRSRDRFLATSHEYALYYASASRGATIAFAPLSPEQEAEYKFEDAVGKYKWRDFLRTGGYSIPRERPHSHYNIFWHEPTKSIVVFADPDSKVLEKKKGRSELARFQEMPGASVRKDLGELPAYVLVPAGQVLPPLHEFAEIEPLDSTGQQRVWRQTRLPFMLLAANGDIQISTAEGRWKVEIKDRIKRGVRPKSVVYSVADEKEFDASAYGTKLLQKMFGRARVFSYPKALETVKLALENMVGDDEEALVCDYFAGSGTTGHAIIDMNREGTNRKYILIEMAQYVDEVTIPRLKKAAYSSAWKDGRPESSDAISHAIKVVRLESYEDALENVVVRGDDGREPTLSLFQEFRQEYVPKDLLREDVQRSSAFLPGSALAGPKSLTISALDHGGQRQPVGVDLSETLCVWLGMRAVRRRRGESIEVTIGWIDDALCALALRDVRSVDSDRLVSELSAALGADRIERLIVNGDASQEVIRKGGFDADVFTIEELLRAAT